jgi:hypothetical protein
MHQATILSMWSLDIQEATNTKIWSSMQHNKISDQIAMERLTKVIMKFEKVEMLPGHPSLGSLYESRNSSIAHVTITTYRTSTHIVVSSCKTRTWMLERIILIPLLYYTCKSSISILVANYVIDLSSLSLHCVFFIVCSIQGNVHLENL